jgi:chemotaxis response regulator CheB
VPVVVLYDPDAQRRERLRAELAGREIATEACYSLDAARHRLAKTLARPAILVHPRSRSSEVVALKGRAQLSLVSFADDLGAGGRKLDVAPVVSAIEAAKAALRRAGHAASRATGKSDILVIGSSTGGFPIAQQMLDQLDLQHTIVILCQHISSEAAGDLEQAVSSRVRGPVVLVDAQTELDSGTVYVLGGGKDFSLRDKYSRLYLVPATDPGSPYHPSLNHLAESLLSLSGLDIACVILSGLANDGSRHLERLRNAGITLVAQDPSTAVAPGMPDAAIKTGAVAQVFDPAGLRDFAARRCA